MKKNFTLYKKLKPGAGINNCQNFGLIITFTYSHNRHILSI